MRALVAPKIDAHCHVFDPARHPYAPDVAYRPAGAEIAPAAYWRAVMDAYGIRHALLVQPNSGYGEDLRCLLDALDQGQGRFRGVVIASPQTSDAELRAMKARGVVGVAHNVALLGAAAYAGWDAFWARLAAHGLLLQVQVQDEQMAALAPRLLASGATLLVDHCGRPDLSRPLPDSPGFQALLALADSGRCHVKLSGFDKFSRQAYPFSDAQPVVQALLQRFGTDRCLWASDWPHLRATQRLDMGALLALVDTWIPDPAQRAAVLHDNARGLFGF